MNKYDNTQTNGIWENRKIRWHISRTLTERLVPSELRYVLNLYTETIRLARARNAEKSYLESLVEFSCPVREKLEASLELQKKAIK